MADKIKPKATWSNVSNVPKTVIESLTVKPSEMPTEPSKEIIFDIEKLNETIHNATTTICQQMQENSLSLKSTVDSYLKDRELANDALKDVLTQINNFHISISELATTCEELSKNVHLSQSVLQVKANDLLKMIKDKQTSYSVDLKPTLSFSKAALVALCVVPLIYTILIFLAYKYLV